MNDLKIYLRSLFMCFFVLFSTNVYAAIDGNAVKVTQHMDKVFERMLMAAEKEDVDKVNKAMVLLEDLNQQVHSTINVNLKDNLTRAIEGENIEKIKSTIQQSIYYSILYLMEDCFEGINSTSEVKDRIKSAYKLYLLLDYYISKERFEISKMIKSSFRQSNFAVGVDPKKLSQSCMEIKKGLKDFLF